MTEYQSKQPDYRKHTKLDADPVSDEQWAETKRLAKEAMAKKYCQCGNLLPCKDHSQANPIARPG